jgi:Fur family ferric uptake transcriptional regulator
MTIHKAKEILTDYLREKGLRSTKQREEILSAFLSADKHITVEELFNIIKTKNPEIGYATVHRNLSLLCECGLADEIKIGTKKARYEPKLGQEHHDHLICLKCGSFIEVNDQKIEKLQDKLAAEKNFIPVRHKLEIYGICKQCK